MLERIRIDDNLKDKLKKAMREWNKNPSFLSNEDYNRYKKDIIERLESGLELKSEHLERNSSEYILHLSFGKSKLEFKEDAKWGLTVFDFTDKYGDKVSLLSKTGRPLKLKELFFDKKSIPNKKTERQDKPCNVCENINRATAKFCDQCGREL